MSALCQVDKVYQTVNEYNALGNKVDFDIFFVNATSKAFSKVFGIDKLTTSKVGHDAISFYDAPNKT